MRIFLQMIKIKIQNPNDEFKDDKEHAIRLSRYTGMEWDGRDKSTDKYFKIGSFI